MLINAHTCILYISSDMAGVVQDNFVGPLCDTDSRTRMSACLLHSCAPAAGSRVTAAGSRTCKAAIELAERKQKIYTLKSKYENVVSKAALWHLFDGRCGRCLSGTR